MGQGHMQGVSRGLFQRLEKAQGVGDERAMQAFIEEIEKSTV